MITLDGLEKNKEKNKLEHETELNLLASKIHSDMSKVLEGLKEIERKTKVVSEDISKSMYNISFVKWDEAEGTNLIKKHIYNILEDLEQERFKGIGQEGEIKKYVGTMLKTANILKAILGLKIKISVKKVDSNGRLSSNFLSWEKS